MLEEEQRQTQSSTASETEEEEKVDITKAIGPKSDVSLLDQHSRLKKEAEGNTCTDDAL